MRGLLLVRHLPASDDRQAEIQTDRDRDGDGDGDGDRDRDSLTVRTILEFDC